jgi:hypothetical protein
MGARSIEVVEAPKRQYGYGWLVRWDDGEESWFAHEGVARDCARGERSESRANVDELRAMLEEVLGAWTQQEVRDRARALLTRGM